jgi:hypothetical protein
MSTREWYVLLKQAISLLISLCQDQDIISAHIWLEALFHPPPPPPPLPTLANQQVQTAAAPATPAAAEQESAPATDFDSPSFFPILTPAHRVASIVVLLAALGQPPPPTATAAAEISATPAATAARRAVLRRLWPRVQALLGDSSVQSVRHITFFLNAQKDLLV